VSIYRLYSRHNTLKFIGTAYT